MPHKINLNKIKVITKTLLKTRVYKIKHQFNKTNQLITNLNKIQLIMILLKTTFKILLYN